MWKHIKNLVFISNLCVCLKNCVYLTRCEPVKLLSLATNATFVSLDFSVQRLDLFYFLVAPACPAKLSTFEWIAKRYKQKYKHIYQTTLNYFNAKVGWAGATKSSRLAGFESRLGHTENWKNKTCALFSFVLDVDGWVQGKETVHARCCYWLATSAAFLRKQPRGSRRKQSEMGAAHSWHSRRGGGTKNRV